MYQKLTSQYWKKYLNLSNDYKVDALLIAGSGNSNKQNEILDSVINKLSIGNEVIEEKLDFEFFKKVRVININGKRIWFDVVYGGAYMSELMHIGCLFGSRINLFLGSIGALQKGMLSGDIIMPTFTYGEESSAKLYDRKAKDNKYFSDEKLTEEIFKKIIPSFNPKKGSLVTCQAMLGEAWEDILSWSKQDYIGVEMETATLFSVSNYFKVPSAALLYVSDNLIESEFMGSDAHNKTKERRDNARQYNYELALDILISKIK